jgi:hypothetical protein
MICTSQRLNRHRAASGNWDPHDYIPWSDGRSYAALGRLTAISYRLLDLGPRRRLSQDHRMAEHHGGCLTSAAWRDGADARRRVLVTPRLICTNSRLSGDPPNGQLDSLPPPDRLGLGHLPRVVRLPGPNP